MDPCKHGLLKTTCAYCLGLKVPPHFFKVGTGRHILSERGFFGGGGVFNGLRIPAENYKSKRAAAEDDREARRRQELEGG